MPQRRVRHHVVSRFYLDGFADHRGQLLRVPIGDAASHLISVGDATVIKDFYSVEAPDGSLSDYFERDAPGLT